MVRRPNNQLHLIAVGVGDFISFKLPSLENEFIRQESFTGEIEHYEASFKGDAPVIVFKLKNYARIFILRRDYPLEAKG